MGERRENKSNPRGQQKENESSLVIPTSRTTERLMETEIQMGFITTNVAVRLIYNYRILSDGAASSDEKKRESLYRCTCEKQTTGDSLPKVLFPLTDPALQYSV